MTAGHIVGAVFAGGTVLASALLLGLGRAGRALLNLVRRSST